MVGGETGRNDGGPIKTHALARAPPRPTPTPPPPPPFFLPAKPAAKPPAPAADDAAPAPAGAAVPTAAGDATATIVLEAKSSVFDPASSRFSLKGVSPVVIATMGDGADKAATRLPATDFFTGVKGAADAVIVGDRNGTLERVILRLSEPTYDRLTASVDFKAEQRGVDAKPALNGGLVAATAAAPDAGKVAKVLTQLGRPISLNNVAVFVDAKATPAKGAKGVLATGTAADCAGWGCAVTGALSG